MVHRLAWFLSASVAWLFWRVMGLLPVDRASRLGAGIMRALGPRLRKHAIVRANLRQVLPEAGDDEIGRVARQVWANFGAVLAEYPHLGTICAADELKNRIDIVFEQPIELLHGEGKPGIFVAPHTGNWEILAGAVIAMGFPMSVVYSDTSPRNPRIFSQILSMRRRMRCGLLPKQGAGRDLVAAFRSGQSLGILMDQRVESGLAVPFFGRAALTTDVPARLALKFRAQLVPACIQRVDGAHFRLLVGKPIVPDDPSASEREKIGDMTAKINRCFEKWISADPGQWLCAKRRWRDDDVRGASAPVAASAAHRKASA